MVIGTLMHAGVQLMFYVRLLVLNVLGVRDKHVTTLFGKAKSSELADPSSTKLPSARLVALAQVVNAFPKPKLRKLSDVLGQLSQFDSLRAFGSLLGGSEKVEKNCFRRCHWVLPKGSALAALKEHGVVLYTHGGGYVSGTIGSYREVCGLIAKRTGCAVLFVEYSLVPGAPIPQARQECLDAYKWLLEEQGVPASKVAFVGDSAGAGLALGLLQDVASAGLAQPACAVLVSPCADLTNTSASMSEEDSETSDIACVARNFFEIITASAVEVSGIPADHPSNSSLLGDFTGLPPLFVTAGTSERLLDDSATTVAKAEAAGVHVTARFEPYSIHQAPLWGTSFGIPEYKALLTALCEFVVSNLANAAQP